MSHNDFFEATLIEFTQWIKGEEKTIVKFSKFEDLPSHLMEQFKTNSESGILLKGKKWKVLEINKDLRSHGKGMHVKVRLDAIL